MTLHRLVPSQDGTGAGADAASDLDVGRDRKRGGAHGVSAESEGDLAAARRTGGGNSGDDVAAGAARRDGEAFRGPGAGHQDRHGHAANQRREVVGDCKVVLASGRVRRHGHGGIVAGRGRDRQRGGRLPAAERCQRRDRAAQRRWCRVCDGGGGAGAAGGEAEAAAVDFEPAALRDDGGGVGRGVADRPHHVRHVDRAPPAAGHIRWAAGTGAGAEAVGPGGPDRPRQQELDRAVPAANHPRRGREMVAAAAARWRRRDGGGGGRAVGAHRHQLHRRVGQAAAHSHDGGVRQRGLAVPEDHWRCQWWRLRCLQQC